MLLSDLDVIVVCTYNNVAPDIVCASLKKGLHVFCEKPPGRCVADVERIIDLKNTVKDRVLKYGFNHRFHYSVMEAKAIIDSGRFGSVLCARGTYGKAGGLGFEKKLAIGQRACWRRDFTRSGNSYVGSNAISRRRIYSSQKLC